MEFKPSGEFSKLTKLQENEVSLVNGGDVKSMLKNLYLHDIHSHFIVTPEGTYDDEQGMGSGVRPGQIEKLEQAYSDGCTIVIKDLETWNRNIIKRCRQFNGPTNVHLYLSPAGGSGFGWHTDDRDVYVHGQIGEKSFEVREPNGEISSYTIKEGDVLFIPYGAKHRALATERPSVHLSFGVWPKEMTIKESYQEFEVPLNLEL